MPRPPKDMPPSICDMFGPLRHIEHVIEEAYWKLPPHQRKKAGNSLYAAREYIRRAGEILGDK